MRSESSTDMCVAVWASACERKASACLEDTTKDEESMDAAVRRRRMVSTSVSLVTRKSREGKERTCSTHKSIINGRLP